MDLDAKCRYPDLVVELFLFSMKIDATLEKRLLLAILVLDDCLSSPNRRSISSER
jgi:hypothetical protein